MELDGSMGCQAEKRGAGDRYNGAKKRAWEEKYENMKTHCRRVSARKQLQAC